MFKTNLSPLNQAKEKYTPNNFDKQNNEHQNLQNYHQSTYQYTKGLYTGNGMTHQKH